MRRAATGDRRDFNGLRQGRARPLPLPAYCADRARVLLLRGQDRGRGARGARLLDVEKATSRRVPVEMEARDEAGRKSAEGRRSRRDLANALNDSKSRVFDDIRRFYKGIAVSILPKGVRKKITGFVRMAGRHSFQVNEVPTTVVVSLSSVLDALSESAHPSVFILNDELVRRRAGILGEEEP